MTLHHSIGLASVALVDINCRESYYNKSLYIKVDFKD